MSTSASNTCRQNLVVLRGAVVAPPQPRTLPSGSVVVQFDVRTSLGPDGTGGAASVPVSWPDPPAADLDSVTAGKEVTVIGSVQRRFFRVGGATQSRTEVVVETLVPDRRKRTVRSAIARAVESLGD